MIGIDTNNVDQQLSIVLSLILAITIVLILVKFVYWWIFLVISLSLLVAAWVGCKIIAVSLQERARKEALIYNEHDLTNQRQYLTCTHCKRYPAIIKRIIDGKDMVVEHDNVVRNNHNIVPTHIPRRQVYGPCWRTY